MWESLASILKFFLEKRLFSTVISVVCGILALLYLPEEYSWMLEKIGKFAFVALVAGIVFLILSFVIHVFKSINEYKFRHSMLIDNKKQEIRDSEKDIDTFMSFFDGVSPDERELVVKLIKSNNTPIEQRGLRCNNGRNSIFSTNFIVKTQNKNGSYLIKINPLVFYKAKEVYEKYGAISHFE